jgi:hypothetical protein
MRVALCFQDILSFLHPSEGRDSMSLHHSKQMGKGTK